MALTISGSGGGLTAPEVIALTGWNALASVPIDVSGNFNTSSKTGTFPLATFSSYGSGLDLTEYSECRLRFVPSKVSFDASGTGIDQYLFQGASFDSTKYQYHLYYVMGSYDGTPDPMVGIIFNATANKSRFIAGSQIESSTSIFDFKMYINKYTTTSYSKYVIKGTLYFEGRK